MRDFAKISPEFWIGETGKQLRGHPEAQIVGAYLLSNPHANMIGLYYLPVTFVVHETGLSLEGASEGLRRLIEVGFCDYDQKTETVWVFEMAKYQVGVQLDKKDLRCKGVQNAYDSCPQSPFLPLFFDRYAGNFHLTAKRENLKPKQRGLQGASKQGEGEGELKTGVAEKKSVDNSEPTGSIPLPWWTDENTVLAKGREVKCDPRPGEDMMAFKKRLGVELAKRDRKNGARAH